MQANTAFFALLITVAGALGAPLQAAEAPSTALTSGLTSKVIDQAAPTPQPAPKMRETLVENGVATWYGHRHSHHYTVSGERFDPRRMTAAHRSLPIGTMVRVTDRNTGRSVIVRINDREPPHGARCIDLSEGAARALGIRSQGLANVTIAALARPDAVEVAEAPDDAVAPDQAQDASAKPVTRRHGAHHHHAAGRKAKG